MAKKALISGYIGFSNFGDDVIFSILSRHLKAAGFSVSALSSNPEKTSSQFKVKALHYKNPFDILRGIFECDYLVSGGGSLLQNTTSNMSLLYYVFIIFIAKLMCKKVIIFAQGIGPIYGKFWQWLVKITLSMSNLVTVRDKYSYKLLTRWKIKCRYVCDPAWDIPTLPRENKGYVGIQLREYPLMHERFIKELAKYVGIYFSDRKVLIFSFQRTQDSKICWEFERELKSQWPDVKTELKTGTTMKKIIEDFSTLEYIISMRFHACLLGLKYGIKVFPLSYDIKVDNLAKEFELPVINVVEEPINYNDKFGGFLQHKEHAEISEKRKMRFDWSAIDKYMHR